MSSIEFDHNLQIRTETDVMLFQPPRKWRPIPECINCIGLLDARSKLNQNIEDYGGLDFPFEDYSREIRCYVSAEYFSTEVDINVDFISPSGRVTNSKMITKYPKAECKFFINKLHHESPEHVDKNNPESFLDSNF